MRVLVTLVLTFAGMWYGFRDAAAGTPQFWLGATLPYLPLVALALHKMWQEGTLVDLLTPRWGDLSIGATSMIALLFASWAARRVLSPAGNPRQAWLFHIYLQLGNPEHLQRSTAYTLLILMLCAAEEIVWRGMVLGDLNTFVQILQTHGDQQIADAIERLTIAIGKSAEIRDADFEKTCLKTLRWYRMRSHLNPINVDRDC